MPTKTKVKIRTRYQTRHAAPPRQRHYDLPQDQAQTTDALRDSTLGLLLRYKRAKRNGETELMVVLVERYHEIIDELHYRGDL